MPLNNADIKQIDDYINSGQIRQARRMLEDAKDDPRAVKALAKLNRQHPPTATTPVVPPPPPKPVQPVAKPKPISSSPVSSSTGDDIEEAKRAIRERRYDDAESLLILSDHPDAPKLLERLAMVRGNATNLEGKVKPVYVQTGKDFTNKFTIATILIFVAFIPGLIAFELFAAEAKQYPDAPGAQKIIRTRRNILILTAIILSLACFAWTYNARMAHLAYEAWIHS